MSTLPNSPGAPRAAESRRRVLPVALLSILIAACTDTAVPGGPTESEVRGRGLQIVSSSRTTPRDAGEREFERPNFHSFGRVPDGRSVAHVFLIKNTDDRPLTIKRIVPGCGCTVPSVRYTDAAGEVVEGTVSRDKDRAVLEIPVGVTAELEVRVNTNDVPTKNNNKTVSITVSTDSPNGYYLTLETHIFVEKPFTQSPSGIDFGRVPINGVTTDSVKLVRMGGYETEIIGILSKPDDVEAELEFDSGQGVAIWRLTVTLLPPLELGLIQREIVLETSNGPGEPGEPVTVRLLANQVNDIDVTPLRIVFSGRTSDSSGKVNVTSLLNGHTFRITNVILPEEHRGLLTASAEPQDSGSPAGTNDWLVVLTATDRIPPGKLLKGELLVQLDDPQHPEVRVRYVVHPPKS